MVPCRKLYSIIYNLNRIDSHGRGRSLVGSYCTRAYKTGGLVRGENGPSLVVVASPIIRAILNLEKPQPLAPTLHCDECAMGVYIWWTRPERIIHYTTGQLCVYVRKGLNKLRQEIRYVKCISTDSQLTSPWIVVSVWMGTRFWKHQFASSWAYYSLRSSYYLGVLLAPRVFFGSHPFGKDVYATLPRTNEFTTHKLDWSDEFT